MTNEEAIELLYDIQTDAVYKVLSDEKEALDMAIKALEQQPCEDCINRAEAIKETKKLLRGNYDPEYIVETLKMLPLVTPKALEQQPCEDAISREAVDEYIVNLLSGYLYDEERTRLEDLTAYIWELPSVTPTRPTGKWIEKTGEGFDAWAECSKCGCVNPFEDDFNYCPNCGAKMEEKE